MVFQPRAIQIVFSKKKSIIILFIEIKLEILYFLSPIHLIFITIELNIMFLSELYYLYYFHGA